MVLFIVPECSECKTQKNVETDAAYTKDKTRFLVTYCTKCLSVIGCELSAILVKKKKKGYGRSYGYGTASNRDVKHG